MAHILVVEDNSEIAQLIIMILGEKHRLTHAENIEAAKAAVEESRFDLFLFDVSLPDGSGFDLYAWAKTKQPKTPAVFLTGNGELSDRLKGFELGAEDFITKPFYAPELLARVNTRLKGKENETPEVFQCEGLKFDFQKMRVNFNDQVLGLTPNEFRILSFLCQNLDKTVSREAIAANVWGEGFALSGKVLNTHVSNLRKKIQETGFKITALEGQGYGIAHEAK